MPAIVKQTISVTLIQKSIILNCFIIIYSIISEIFENILLNKSCKLQLGFHTRSDEDVRPCMKLFKELEQASQEPTLISLDHNVQHLICLAAKFSYACYGVNKLFGVFILLIAVNFFQLT